MLESIKNIKNFGVFENHLTEVLFLKYNLLYGWNGSGKSTLSRVFDSFSENNTAVFPDGDYKIKFQGLDYTKANIVNSRIKIATFNQDFIKKNLSFETHKAKGILYISEEKIEEKKQLEQKITERDNLKAEFNQKKSALESLGNEISSEHTKIARNVKNSFGIIHTQNSKFFNYDKRKLENFLSINKDKISDKNILSSEKIELTKLAAQATEKMSLAELPWISDVNVIKEVTLKVQEVVEKNIVAAQIQKLVSNQELNNWVEGGLVLHKKMASSACEFCGSLLSSQRMKELEAHFSNEYQVLLLDILKTLRDIENIDRSLDFQFADNADFYAEFYARVKKIKEDVDLKKIEIKRKLSQIKKIVEDKKSNPFQTVEWMNFTLEVDFEHLEKIIKDFNRIINEHNKKTAAFETSVSSANDLLEIHFISEQMSDGILVQKKANFEQQAGELELIKNRLDFLEIEVRELETKLVNVAIAADRFNKALESFIGRSDIHLAFENSQGGYLFYRNDGREVASNLSEGEKTAIAFIYFLTKLQENGSNIEETTIVLDDPISSFDSKNLHSAFGFIQQHLGCARQLFILTHNFEFFKLVRNWLKKKNERNKNGVIHEKSKFYLVQSKLCPNRTSEIVDLPLHLLNYESEYHYLFGRILSYKETLTPSFEHAHFIGNASRKILEAFLAFKYPSSISDFTGLLKKACENDTNTFQKISSFINRYSHSQTLEFFEAGSDNLFSESQNIVVDVLRIIKSLDQNHYEEMKKVCSSSSNVNQQA